MTKAGKFIKFLGILRTSENGKLLECIEQGFRTVVESMNNNQFSTDSFNRYARRPFFMEFIDEQKKADPNWNEWDHSVSIDKEFAEWKKENVITEYTDEERAEMAKIDPKYLTFLSNQFGTQRRLPKVDPEIEKEKALDKQIYDHIDKKFPNYDREEMFKVFKEAEVEDARKLAKKSALKGGRNKNF